MAVDLWHNPRCSKSRQALAYLRDRGIDPQVRLYLQDPPSAEEIGAMLVALGLPAADLLRHDAASLKTLPEAAIIAAMAADSSRIERPLVRNGTRAVIGRPTEAIAALLA